MLYARLPPACGVLQREDPAEEGRSLRRAATIGAADGANAGPSAAAIGALTRAALGASEASLDLTPPRLPSPLPTPPDADSALLAGTPQPPLYDPPATPRPGEEAAVPCWSTPPYDGPPPSQNENALEGRGGGGRSKLLARDVPPDGLLAATLLGW